jgi:tripartite-type tricarboxylate transporter receptor subunit TctC
MTHRLSAATPVAAAFALAFMAPSLSAQEFPQRPVRIMVGFSAGSVVDVSARVLGEKMSEGLRQPVVIDNRPSAGGIVAGELVARGNPDGSPSFRSRPRMRSGRRSPPSCPTTS